MPAGRCCTRRCEGRYRLNGSNAIETHEVARAVVAARQLAARVSIMAAGLAAAGPFDAHRVAALHARKPDVIDAWAWRFAMLARHLRNGIWPGVAEAEDLRHLGTLSGGELAELMERLRLLARASDYEAATALGEAIISIDATETERAASLLDASLAAVPLLVGCVDRAEAWAARRLTPPASP